MGHVLYSFRRCPYAMRARMALFVSETQYEHREILLRDKPNSMLRASSKGTVPVLILETGDVLDESIDVMMWALRENDPQHWLAPDQQKMQALIDLITGEFKHHLDRYKYASRYQDEADRFSVNLEHRAEAIKILENFEERLTNGPYLMGENVSLADFAVFPFIRQFANVERDWWNQPVFPAIRAWLEGFLASELFQAIMQKHPLWADPET